MNQALRIASSRNSVPTLYPPPPQKKRTNLDFFHSEMHEKLENSYNNTIFAESTVDLNMLTYIDTNGTV